MSGLEIAFLIVALITLYAALEVVTTNNLIHAALWLIVTLFGVAGIFVLLSAPFLAVVQVMVYIGAIAILMIFAIMLTRSVGKAEEVQVNKNWPIAAVFGFFMFAGLAVILIFSGKGNNTMPFLADGGETIAELGKALVSPSGYVLPFELASVLLLAALIGAIVIAWRK
ncbi:MAG TPA: proton-conducting membrane transporter [Chloroflexi bacterium]|nr:proton-conducting membrane transporter [Chloroflexota bacterium]HBY07632.1 proton-conducting membrane transporter [Chloroflexota bacterium]